jgi:SnoaL-like domain
LPRVTVATGASAVEAYAAAWRESDPAARLALLKRCWAEDGVYCDPRRRAEGRGGLAEHIAGFHRREPGARIDVVSGVDEHDGYLRFDWRMFAADGSVALEGTDFGELDDRGALRRIVGFFDPPPQR